MKRFTKCLCLILALSLVLAIPVSAQEATSPYSSSFFMSRAAYLWRTSSTSFQVWFEITAVRGMQELGVKYIDIERSSDGVNWSVVKTYDRSSYSNLIVYNTANHCSYVTYNDVQSGYQYRAYVHFYAKDSTGSATSGALAYFSN